MPVASRMRVLAGVFAATALAPPAGAAAQTDVVVWSGGRTPGVEVVGVRVTPDGTARVLAPRNRAKGTVRVVARYRPTGAQLGAIRAAAKSALTGATFAGESAQDGFYAAAVVEVDGESRALVGANALPPKLAALMDAVYGSLPPTNAGAAHARTVVLRARARAAALPATAPCPPGQAPVHFAREISLKQAAALGIVKVTAKGGADGDAMAVTANFKDVPLPTVVRMDVEVVSDLENVDKGLERKVERDLAGQKIASGPLAGQPVRFDLNVHRRLPSEPPRPCWHQVALSRDTNLRDHVDTLGPALSSGEFQQGNEQAWTHELLHLAGLDDRYDDYFRYGGKSVKLPERGLEGAALTAELRKLGVRNSAGVLVSRAHPGWKGNIMAQVPGGKVFDVDLKGFAYLAQDEIVIHAEAGDILLDKKSGQNLVNGSRFDLSVSRGGPPAHVDGMYVYCLDQYRDLPERGDVFDVLGPAGEQGDPAMAALARVLGVVDRRRSGPLERLPGAQLAVWRVTDDQSPDEGGAEGEAARAILVEAGVEPDPSNQTFNAPHYDNPNAGSPDTGAVTPSSVLGPPDLGPPLPRLARPRPKLVRAAFSPRRLRRATRVLASLTVTLAPGAGDRITVTLERKKGRRFRRVRRLARLRVGDGQTTIPLVLRGLRPGSYRVRVEARRGAARLAPFRVR